jgi:hypothetical protein
MFVDVELPMVMMGIISEPALKFACQECSDFEFVGVKKRKLELLVAKTVIHKKES